MDEDNARYIAEYWSGGGGLVPRGPRSLLACVQVTPAEVQRHTGRRIGYGTDLWRIEVSGRFLRSGGTVYPGGVPFPEELHSQTAIIAGEVWLYATDDGDVLGSYWWPDAIRRPIAAKPQPDFEDADVLTIEDATTEMPFKLKAPASFDWTPAVAVRVDTDEVIVFCIQGQLPEPLNEMVAYEQGGLTLRMAAERERPDVDEFLARNQPPFRRVKVRLSNGIGRDLGRSLGPQTWPWPAELRWWESGVSYELKGFQQLNALVDVATSLIDV